MNQKKASKKIGIVTSKSDQLARDASLVRRIKPKLRKFVIDLQRERAQKTAEEQQKEKEILVSSDEIINRAGKLASFALLQKRLWQQITPTLEMRWTKLGVANPELAREQHSDIAGFATYLVREYNNFLKLKATGRGYLSPLDDKNLEFFWAKFNRDLKLLIEAEMRRVKAGNASVILGHKAANGTLELIKQKIIN